MSSERDRLQVIKDRLGGARVYYSIPNPRSTYLMDVENAADDIRWLIYEVERLRQLAGDERGDPDGK